MKFDRDYSALQSTELPILSHLQRPLSKLLVRTGLAMAVLATVTGCGNKPTDQEVMSREYGRFVKGEQNCVKGGKFPIYTLSKTEEEPPEGLTVRGYFSQDGSFKEETFYKEGIWPFPNPQVFDLSNEESQGIEGVDKQKFFIIEVVTGYAIDKSTEETRERMVLREFVMRCPYIV